MQNQQNEYSPISQQIGMLNFRINDMLTQLTAVIKTMSEENLALKRENAELKAQQQKTNQ
jgi:hypothetical protein